MDSKRQLWFPASCCAPWFYSCHRNRYNSTFTSVSLPYWRKLQPDHLPSHLCLYHWIVLVPFLWIPFSRPFFFFFLLRQELYQIFFPKSTCQSPISIHILISVPFYSGQNSCPLQSAGAWAWLSVQHSQWHQSEACDFTSWHCAVHFDCGKTKAGSLDSCHSSRGNRQR